MKTTHLLSTLCAVTSSFYHAQAFVVKNTPSIPSTNTALNSDRYGYEGMGGGYNRPVNDRERYGAGGGRYYNNNGYGEGPMRSANPMRYGNSYNDDRYSPRQQRFNYNVYDENRMGGGGRMMRQGYGSPYSNYYRDERPGQMMMRNRGGYNNYDDRSSSSNMMQRGRYGRGGGYGGYGRGGGYGDNYDDRYYNNRGYSPNRRGYGRGGYSMNDYDRNMYRSQYGLGIQSDQCSSSLYQGNAYNDGYYRNENY